MKKSKLLCKSAEWDSSDIERMWEVIRKIAVKKYNLDFYEPQFEIVSAEQMLDAYSSIGLPNMYNHWSFGKNYIEQRKAYEAGQTGLALEMVINTNPCIGYYMEDNTSVETCMVIAHAQIGHSNFFKNNFMFKDFTQANNIVAYVDFARKYIAKCEQSYGADRVERILDIGHMLARQGVDHYKRPAKKSKTADEHRKRSWIKYLEDTDTELLDVLPNSDRIKLYREIMSQELWKESESWEDVLPEDNLLYFLEKHSPILKSWEREILRIVRKINQYFYPQGLTKLMNEGWATFWHYTLMHDLYDQGYLTEGNMIEFYDTHSRVIPQPAGGSINPYALGFSMFQDLRRLCENPTAQDRKEIPMYAGQDWITSLKDVMQNYQDNSFILQCLTSKVMEKFRLFCFHDGEDKKAVDILDVSDSLGYDNIKSVLASQYEHDHYFPNLEVSHVDDDKRVVTVEYKVKDGVMAHKDIQTVLDGMEQLHGYKIKLRTPGAKVATRDRVILTI